MPEMIFVSIQNTNRSRDLTPTDDGKGGNVGGGDKFLEFHRKGSNSARRKKLPHTTVSRFSRDIV